MLIDLKMPSLSPTMETGTLAKWFVGPGDAIHPGDLIAEIETDKATMELEATDEGIIAAILISEGTDNVPVGLTIATILDEHHAAPPSPKPAEPIVLPPKADVAVQRQARGSRPTIAPGRRLVDPATDASPLARLISGALDIDLASIRGTGVMGRILKADLEPDRRPPVQPLRLRPAAGASVTASGAQSMAYNVDEHAEMEKSIARRLADGRESDPCFYLSVHCHIDALLRLHTELNAGLIGRGITLAVDDMVLKAMALAMASEPDANVKFANDEMRRSALVNIALSDASGPVAPIIHDVARLSLSAIGLQRQTLITLARDGGLPPDQHRDGTASLMTSGVLGADVIIAAVDPVHVLALGIGTAVEKPWSVDGQIVLATVMTVTGSFNRRFVNREAAGRLMAMFRGVIENPIDLLL
jgi:pyruvate dehydrogenase E2 component (dihydrolipoamide acetyltransferase)